MNLSKFGTKGMTVVYFADKDAEESSQEGSGGTAESRTQLGSNEQQESEFNVYQYINEDGTFSEGWQKALVEEGLQNQGIYSRIKDIKTVMSILGNQERAISKKGIIPIDDKSSPEEVAAFRQAMGIPAKPEDYKLTVPQGLEEYYDDALTTEARAVMHKLNLTQKQFEGIMALDLQRIVRMQELEQEGLQLAEIQAEEQINKQFGANKAKVLHNANLAIKELTKDWPKEERDLIFGENSGINSPEFAEYRPLFLKLFSAIGGYFNEDTGIRFGSISDPATLDSQIGSITAQLTEQLRRTDRKKYDELVAQREMLYQKRYPSGS